MVEQLYYGYITVSYITDCSITVILQVYNCYITDCSITVIEQVYDCYITVICNFNITVI